MAMADFVILIGGGYGAFLFSGTDAEAEDMRAHKARWERGPGRKRLATDNEVRAGVASQCINHPGFNNRAVFVDCNCDDENCVADAYDRQEQASGS